MRTPTCCTKASSWEMNAIFYHLYCNQTYAMAAACSGSASCPRPGSAPGQTASRHSQVDKQPHITVRCASSASCSVSQSTHGHTPRWQRCTRGPTWSACRGLSDTIQTCAAHQGGSSALQPHSGAHWESSFSMPEIPAVLHIHQAALHWQRVESSPGEPAAACLGL